MPCILFKLHLISVDIWNMCPFGFNLHSDLHVIQTTFKFCTYFKHVNEKMQPMVKKKMRMGKDVKIGGKPQTLRTGR